MINVFQNEKMKLNQEDQPDLKSGRIILNFNFLSYDASQILSQIKDIIMNLFFKCENNKCEIK